MYVQKGQHVRIFTNKIPKTLFEGTVNTVTNEFLRIQHDDGSLSEIRWNDVADIHPVPHLDPNHMFDRYSLMEGDRIRLTYYMADGSYHEAIGFVANIRKSTIVLYSEGTYSIIAPFNIENLAILQYVPRKQPKQDIVS